MQVGRRKFVVGGAALGVAISAPVGGAAAAVPQSRPAPSSTSPQREISEEFFIPEAPNEVWRVFTDPIERGVWFGYPGKPGSAGEKLRLGEWTRTPVDHPGMPGPYETAVKLEAVAGGTRITHTISGYGEGPVWENAVQSSADGIAEMFGDLAIYLRTGVGFPRHTGRAFPNRPGHPNDLRTGTRSVPGGLEILEVFPGTLAAEAGLQPQDVVVAIGDAGIFGMRDMRLFNLAHTPGDVVEVTWVRGRKLMTGEGRMVQAPIRWRNGFDPTKRP